MTIFSGTCLQVPQILMGKKYGLCTTQPHNHNLEKIVKKLHIYHKKNIHSIMSFCILLQPLIEIVFKSSNVS